MRGCRASTVNASGPESRKILDAALNPSRRGLILENMIDLNEPEWLNLAVIVGLALFFVLGEIGFVLALILLVIWSASLMLSNYLRFGQIKHPEKRHPAPALLRRYQHWLLKLIRR